MMAGNYIQFALFVTLQISIVLCRSTGAPDNNEFIASSYIPEVLKDEALIESVAPELIASSSSPEIFKAEALKETVAPGELTNDDAPIHVAKADVYSEGSDVLIILVIIYLVFILLSFILGCVLYYRSKSRAVRRGHIINSTTGVQSFGIKQPDTAM